MPSRSVFAHTVWAVAISAVFPSGFAFCGEIRWKTDLKEAARESQRTQKPMLLEFTASWCRYCKKMKRTTFRDQNVIRHVNECFVPVSVDSEKNPRLMKAAGVAGLPTTVIISPEFEIAKKITGYQTAAQLQRHLGKLCQPASFEQSASKSPRKPTVGRARIDSKPSGTARKQSVSQKRAVTRKRARTDVSQTSPARETLTHFDGRCLVSMLKDRKVKFGKREFSLKFRGYLLRFATAEYKRRFESDPKRFWPANDGNCPVTLRDKAKRIAGSPLIAVIYRGRLWLFASQGQRKLFAESPAKYAAELTVKRD